MTVAAKYIGFPRKTVRRLSIVGLFAALLAPLYGSTLRQLSLDDMIRQSTVIVRGKVQPTLPAFHGSMIFSHYRVQVSEVYKGTAPGGQIDIGVPGGISNGIQQRYAGAPALSSDQDYVLFLWTSRTGLTQVIGLSQGLFGVVSTAGQLVVVRAASTERMLDGAGQQVKDSDIQMLLNDLRNHIQQVLSARGGK